LSVAAASCARASLAKLETGRLTQLKPATPQGTTQSRPPRVPSTWLSTPAHSCGTPALSTGPTTRVQHPVVRSNFTLASRASSYTPAALLLSRTCATCVACTSPLRHTRRQPSSAAARVRAGAPRASRRGRGSFSPRFAQAHQLVPCSHAHHVPRTRVTPLPQTTAGAPLCSTCAAGSRPTNRLTVTRPAPHARAATPRRPLCSHTHGPRAWLALPLSATLAGSLLLPRHASASCPPTSRAPTSRTHAGKTSHAKHLPSLHSVWATSGCLCQPRRPARSHLQFKRGGAPAVRSFPQNFTNPRHAREPQLR